MKIPGIRLLKENERAAVFRWGRFHGVLGPGWLFYVPLGHAVAIVDLHKAIPELKSASVDEDEIKRIVEFLVLVYPAWYGMSEFPPSNLALRNVLEDMRLSKEDREDG